MITQECPVWECPMCADVIHAYTPQSRECVYLANQFRENHIDAHVDELRYDMELLLGPC